MIVVFLYGQPEDRRFQPNSRATKPMGFLLWIVTVFFDKFLTGIVQLPLLTVTSIAPGANFLPSCVLLSTASPDFRATGILPVRDTCLDCPGWRIIFRVALIAELRGFWNLTLWFLKSNTARSFSRSLLPRRLGISPIVGTIYADIEISWPSTMACNVFSLSVTMSEPSAILIWRLGTPFTGRDDRYADCFTVVSDIMDVVAPLSTNTVSFPFDGKVICSMFLGVRCTVTIPSLSSSSVSKSAFVVCRSFLLSFLQCDRHN